MTKEESLFKRFLYRRMKEDPLGIEARMYYAWYDNE